MDDVGWWSGEDSHLSNEPFRTGISRNHCVNDYTAIAELAKMTGTRIQAGFVLCEWDRENILRNVPSSTWMGGDWDNSKHQGPWLDEAADVIIKNRPHIEIALHAIGHEYWKHPGPFSRAEWADMDGVMRPASDIVAHTEAFRKIMEQNSLGDFPTSFVPSAFKHCFGAEENGITPILKSYGINFISNPFDATVWEKAPEDPAFGIDGGIPFVNRGRGLISWKVIDASPEGIYWDGPICGLHWPNILNPVPEENSLTVECWADYLNKNYVRSKDRVMAKDSIDCWTQLLCSKKLPISLTDSAAVLDFSKLNAGRYPYLGKTFRIKTDFEISLPLNPSVLSVKKHGLLLFEYEIGIGSELENLTIRF